MLELMLGDNQHGEMWLRFVDTAAYGNNLLHVCIELHNIDFTRAILAKNDSIGADLLTQKNGDGLTPS